MGHDERAREDAARVTARVAAVALVPWAWLTWRLAFVCDDAWISFRYARHLAGGQGLVFNPGERVEGYSNLLWVLVLAAVEAVGGDPALGARALSAACGAALVVLFARTAARRAPAGAAAAALVLGTLPPLAVWSTGGLATMPFALALFGLFAALDAPRPRGTAAAVAAVAAVLLRADGPLWVAPVLAAALWAGRGDRARRRAALAAGAAALLAVAAHTAFRLAYYGEALPLTARAKAGFSALVLERGLAYLASNALAVPALGLALLVGLAARRAPGSAYRLTCALVALWAALYSLRVGGDFMAFGRFLVPALAFVALLAAGGLARLGRARWPVAVALSVTSLLAVGPAVGLPEPVPVAPASLRARFHFRWNTEEQRDEHAQWEFMKVQAERWVVLGRAVRAHTAPGESFVSPAIGAVGYWSERRVLDQMGLTRPEVLEAVPAPRRRSPGHDRGVEPEFFLDVDPPPTYLQALLVPAGQPWYRWPEAWSRDPALARRLRPEWFDLDPALGAPPGAQLRLVRVLPR